MTMEHTTLPELTIISVAGDGPMFSNGAIVDEDFSSSVEVHELLLRLKVPHVFHEIPYTDTRYQVADNFLGDVEWPRHTYQDWLNILAGGTPATRPDDDDDDDDDEYDSDDDWFAEDDDSDDDKHADAGHPDFNYKGAS